MTEHNYYLINAINTHNKRSFTSYHLDGFNYEQTFKYSDTPPIILTEQNLKRDYNENKKNNYNIAYNISRRNYINQVEFIELKYKEFENNNFSFHLKIDLLENGRRKSIFTLEKSKDEPVKQDDLNIIKSILEELNKISQEEKRIFKNIDNTFPDDYHYSFFNGASVDLEVAIKNATNYRNLFTDQFLRLPNNSNYKNPKKSMIVNEQNFRLLFSREHKEKKYNPIFEKDKSGLLVTQFTVPLKNGLKNTVSFSAIDELDGFLQAVMICILILAKDAKDRGEKNLKITDSEFINFLINPIEPKEIKPSFKIVYDVDRAMDILRSTVVAMDVTEGDSVLYKNNKKFQEFLKKQRKIYRDTITNKEEPREIIKNQLVYVERSTKIIGKNGKPSNGYIISFENNVMLKYMESINHIRTVNNNYFKNPKNASPLSIAIFYFLRQRIINMPYNAKTVNSNLFKKKIDLIEKAKEKTKELTQDIKLLESELNNSDIFTDTETLKNELITKKRKTVKDLLKELPEYKKALEYQNSFDKGMFSINLNKLEKYLNMDIKKTKSKLFTNDIKPLLDEWKKELIIEDYELIKKGRILNSVCIKIF